MFARCLTVTVVQFESLTSFHVLLDIFDGVPLLWYTDQRGWCSNLGMFRPFFHTLQDQGYCSQILTTNGCISLRTLHRWGRFVLCLDNVHRTTSTGSTWFRIHSWCRHSPRIHLDIHLWCDETYVEPNMLEFSVAAAAMEEIPTHAPSHVEQPWHAVEACQAIAERLERLLNLRIVTKGT